MCTNILEMDLNRNYSDSDIYYMFNQQNDNEFSFNPTSQCKPIFDTHFLIILTVKALQRYTHRNDEPTTLSFIDELIKLIDCPEDGKLDLYAVKDKTVDSIFSVKEKINQNITIIKNNNKLIILDFKLNKRLEIEMNNHICIIIYKVICYMYNNRTII